MNLKRLVASVAMLATIVAGIGGGAPRVARADTITPIGGGCPQCTLVLPTLTAWPISFHPVTITAYGTGFTPGGAVYIDLKFAYILQNQWHDDGVASTDLTATPPSGVFIGQRFVLTYMGGEVNPTIESPQPCPLAGQYFYYYVVATDVTTGRTASTPPTSHYCN